MIQQTQQHEAGERNITLEDKLQCGRHFEQLLSLQPLHSNRCKRSPPSPPHLVEQQVMLPSRAIRKFLFPTYEVVITSLSHSSALLSERIKCSIPLVDNHINIHMLHMQFADNSRISVKYMIISLFGKHTKCFK